MDRIKQVTSPPILPNFVINEDGSITKNGVKLKVIPLTISLIRDSLKPKT